MLYDEHKLNKMFSEIELFTEGLRQVYSVANECIGKALGRKIMEHNCSFIDGKSTLDIE